MKAAASTSLLQYDCIEPNFSNNDDEPTKNYGSFLTNVYSRKGKQTFNPSIEATEVEHYGFVANFLKESIDFDNIDATYSDDSSIDKSDCLDPQYIEMMRLSTMMAKILFKTFSSCSQNPMIGRLEFYSIIFQILPLRI